jgi:hypothetical protein
LLGRDALLGAESGNWMALELESAVDAGTVVCPGIGTRTGAGSHAESISMVKTQAIRQVGVFNDALLVSWRRWLIGSSRVRDRLRGMDGGSSAADRSHSRLGHVGLHSAVDQP